MTKIAVNRCYGGFSISLGAARRMAELGHRVAQKSVAEYDAGKRVSGEWFSHDIHDSDTSRADPILVQVVTEMGSASNGRYAAIEVVEIPDDVEWTIEDYDGREWVAEKHRQW